MPGELLTEEAPHAGLFGKLPLAGDFVARGLAPAFRLRWDAWATRHLRDGPWPEGGLGLRLLSGGRAAVGLAVPSRDAVGRGFPLAGFLVLSAPPSWEAAQAWTEAARAPLLAAARGALDADALWAALDALPAPGAEAPAPLLLWAGGAAVAADPADPAPALRRLSWRGSSSP